ncbi:hypothetical protein GCM10022227_10990 [Streptomyces sedi]
MKGGLNGEQHEDQQGEGIAYAAGEVCLPQPTQGWDLQQRASRAVTGVRGERLVGGARGGVNNPGLLCSRHVGQRNLTKSEEDRPPEHLPGQRSWEEQRLLRPSDKSPSGGPRPGLPARLPDAAPPRGRGARNGR